MSKDISTIQLVAFTVCVHPFLKRTSYGWCPQLLKDTIQSRICWETFHQATYWYDCNLDYNHSLAWLLV